MILMDGLRKAYKGREALCGVSLAVAAGEIFAYLGPNGAGKTTTIRILSGLTRRIQGKVELNGFDLAAQGVEARAQCGVVAQTINLDQDLTVRENLDIHGRLFAMPAIARRSRIAEVLEYVELADRAGSLVKDLSGGLKRRVTIARALMHEPAILFLDEPTVGLDPNIRRRIWALIKKIQRDGSTVFLTTHYIEEAEFLADRVAFLDHGRLVALDTPENLMRPYGVWAFDPVHDADQAPAFFPTRQQANDYASGREGGFLVRRVNLEDAFRAATGRRLE
ncbi:MAG: ABC transporter ATP-binding protein [Desulfovibrionaceae bacterium]|nr:ABC transporter ATP-binding protein [Desulfovibrionaceae bacterium]